MMPKRVTCKCTPASAGSSIGGVTKGIYQPGNMTGPKAQISMINKQTEMRVKPSRHLYFKNPGKPLRLPWIFLHISLICKSYTIMPTAFTDPKTCH
jgi:hypothetical protein